MEPSETLERVLKSQADPEPEMGVHRPARRERIGFFYKTTKRTCDDCLDLRLAGMCPAVCEGSVKELKMAMDGWRELCERSNKDGEKTEAK